MKEVIAGFCEEYEYPAEAKQTLLKVYEHILKSSAVRRIFEQAGQEYAGNPKIDYSGYLSRLRTACEEENHFLRNKFSADRFSGNRDRGDLVPEDLFAWETVSLLFYICLTPLLYEHYKERKLPDTLCRASLEDLKWKLQECRQVYGIWGSFVPDWFAGFFMLNRFTLGRLQFEPVPFPEEYERTGGSRPAGISHALYVHIPSGRPLLHEDCVRSYRLAAEFFRDIYRKEGVVSSEGITVFVCNSWLLFPEHGSFLPSHSHILEFMKDFDIYASCPDPAGEDLWRIFGQPDCSDPAGLPEKTSLQKAYKKWLLSGGVPGIGKGIKFY